MAAGGWRRRSRWRGSTTMLLTGLDGDVAGRALDLEDDRVVGDEREGVSGALSKGQVGRCKEFSFKCILNEGI
jgi:hypothetical protein